MRLTGTRRPALVDELALDRLRDRDELVHLRRQLAQRPRGPRRSGRGSSGPSRRGTAGAGRPRRARWPPACRRSRRGTCGRGRRPARTSARWAARAPTAIASSGSSMTSTGMPARWSLRTALPGRQRHDRRRRSGSRSMRVTSEKRCSWAPPLVPVARTSTTRMRPAAGSGGRSTGRRGRDPSGSGALIVSRPFVGRAARWIGSSTAPHSYLYGSSPRRKSSRRTPGASARST